jgi:hypothetical protein
MATVTRPACACHANRCPDCGGTLYRWAAGQLCCIDCTTINLGPCSPPPAAECDTPLTYEEAERRAREFSAMLGAEVTANDVINADRDWLERYGRRIDDTYDGYFPEDTL